MLKRPCHLFLAALLFGCAGQGERPPERVAVDRQWITSERGMIYEVGYFTEAQIASRAWEARRRELGGMVKRCESGKRIVRRDVRWFPATEVSGQRCAAVIYTIQCDAPTSAKEDNLARDRQSLLVGELAGEIEKGCGEKDLAKVLANSESDSIRKYKKGLGMLAKREVCDFVGKDQDGPIRIFPETRIAVTAVMDEALAARYPDLETIGRIDYRELVRRQLQASLTWGHKLSNIFPANGKVSDEPVNIRVEIALGLNRAGRPYCAQLTARQGLQVWRRTIERNDPPIPSGAAEQAARKRGESPISQLSDSADLAKAFATALGLPLQAERKGS